MKTSLGRYERVTQSFSGEIAKEILVMVDYFVEVGLPIVTAAIGGVGVFLLQRYLPKRRVSDKEIFKHWRNAFNRRAFKGPIAWETVNFSPPIAKEFHDAIEDTLFCIQTGSCKKGRIKTEGWSSIKKKEWREKMVKIEERLEKIDYIMKSSSNLPEDMARREIDSERDAIISTLNEIWRSYNIEEMTLPTKLPAYGSK